MRLSQLTIEQAADAICLIDSDARIHRVNKAACELSGYSERELRSMYIYDIYTEFEKGQWLKYWEKIEKQGLDQFETSYRDKEGKVFPVEIRANRIDFEGQEFVCHFARDIRDRKRVEKMLRLSQSNLAEAQRLAHLGSWEWNIETNELFWSDEIYRIFGLTPRQFGATYEAFLSSVHPDDRDFVKKSVDEALYEKKTYDIEHRIVLPDGEVRIVNERAEATFNYEDKPIRMIGTVQDITERKEVEEALRQALDEVDRLKNRLQAENIYLQEEIKVEHNFDEIISRNQALKMLLRKVEQVASTDTTVLILGETGTGKELIARAIHNISNRRDHSLVKVNCAALPANLIESELFGHEKGAFTGALARKEGRFKLADGGTIFLDEIGDLPLDLQAKFLRVLQDGEFERLGSTNTIKVDVRVMAATNRNLEEALKNNTFREDLYYRLNVFPIKIPPLRDRKEDIPLLVNHFVKRYSTEIGVKIDQISQSVIDVLQAYHWPGNVRELENVIERAVILTRGNTLETVDLPRNLSADKKQVSADEGKLKRVERDLILNTLKECNWVVDGKRGAAARLGLPPSSLRDKMKKFGIKRPD